MNKNTYFYNDPSINLVSADLWDQQKFIYPELKQKIFEALDDPEIKLSDIVIEKPEKPEHGDFSINLAMRLAGQLKKSPREVAADIVKKLEESEQLENIVEKMEIAGPGFINFFTKLSTYQDKLFEIVELADNYGSHNLLQGKRIMFEYAHPNPYKSVHVGHLRNIISGESAVRLLENMGAEVIHVNYQGDVGMHVAKSLWGMQLKQSEGVDFDAMEGKSSYERAKFIGECYVIGAKDYGEDEQITNEIKDLNYAVYAVIQEQIQQGQDWRPTIKYIDFIKGDIDLENVKYLYEIGKRWSLDEFHRFYKRVYSEFVREYMETDTLYESDKAVQKALEQGILKESEGAVIFDGEEYGLDTRVFLNSMGLPTYEGKEIGLAHLQFRDYGEIDLAIHHVAVEQISFFQVTFKVEELLNPDLFKGKQYHNVYEFVGLKSGKMSSRKGQVVLASDVLDEAEQKILTLMQERKIDAGGKEELKTAAERIGIGAVKYSFLNINPKSYLAFDLDASLNFEGNSGPYLQYTYARANRILSKSQVDDFKQLVEQKELKIESESEINLLKTLTDYENVAVEAAKHLTPNLICSYLYQLSQDFNIFYKNNPVLNEDNQTVRNSRLLLTKATTTVLKNGLDLLGIKTVERM